MNIMPQLMLRLLKQFGLILGQIAGRLRLEHRERVDEVLGGVEVAMGLLRDRVGDPPAPSGPA